MLRAHAIESDGYLAVLTCERLADDPDGFAFERGYSDERLLDRIEQWQRGILDWSVLTIDRRKREVRYRASAICSVPVYAWVHRGLAVLDWDYQRLARGIDALLDWPIALAHIAGIAGYSPQTMVRGLYRATAGATLILDDKGIHAELPEALETEGPQQIAEGCVPEELLFEAMKGLLRARPLLGERTAVEISGGMDSALAGLALAAVLGPGVLSTGAQFRGDMGTAQRERRRLLCELGGFDDLVLPADRFTPFSAASRRRMRFGVWPQDESYPEIFEAIFAALAQAGIDTLVSGFGGDELYPAYVGEEIAAEPEARPPHPYLTDEGRRLAAEGAQDYPPGPLQETCWLAAAGRAQRLLRYGIWPVYPYHSRELARFVGRLPWEYRKDRALLRRVLTARTGSDIFRQGYVKESFRNVALRGMDENKAYLTETVRRSVFANTGLIDMDRVVAALAEDIFALPVSEMEALYLFLTTCCFFQDDGNVRNQPPR